MGNWKSVRVGTPVIVAAGNMLNRVIDGTVQPNAQFVAAIDAARALVPDLRNAFAQGEMGDLEQVDDILVIGVRF